MIDEIITILKIFVLSFTIVYGAWYLGLAMDKIFGFAFGQRDWEWDDE